METFSLGGRTAFVVGGNSGTGRAIVDLFAAHGAKIDIGHFERETQAANAVAALQARGTTLRPSRATCRLKPPLRDRAHRAAARLRGPAKTSAGRTCRRTAATS